MRHPDSVWEGHKQLLFELYMQQNNTLEWTRGHMSSVQNFEASEQQYRRKFTSWGFSKNIPGEYWLVLSQELKRQSLKVCDVDVFFNNRPIDPRTLRKELPRNDPPTLLRSNDGGDSSEDVAKRVVLQTLLTASTSNSSYVNVVYQWGRATDAWFSKLSWVTDMGFIPSKCLQLLCLTQGSTCELPKCAVWRIKSKDTHERGFAFSADGTDLQLAHLLRSFSPEYIERDMQSHSAASTEDMVKSFEKELYERGQYAYVNISEGLQGDARALKEKRMSLTTFLLLALFRTLTWYDRCACFDVLKTYKLSKLGGEGDVGSKVVVQTMLNTLFLSALEHIDLGKCTQLLQAGVSANGQTAYRTKHSHRFWAPMVLATRNVAPRMRRVPFSHGACIDIVPATRDIALGMVRMLISHGAYVDVAGPVGDNRAYHLSQPSAATAILFFSLSPLAIAASHGDVELMAILTDAGADVNFCAQEFGWTPLQAAIVFQHESSVKVLLQNPKTSFTRTSTVWCWGGYSPFLLRPFYFAVLGLDMDTLKHIKDNDIVDAARAPNEGEQAVMNHASEHLDVSYRYPCLASLSHFVRTADEIRDRMSCLSSSDKDLLRDCLRWAAAKE
ncbi:hypothetical protein LTR70_007357 [Exophiala xenobiotica]|uniref:Clr5 domain-containing protein n=1 Tax=Lithohypha guttulata TaxID=1690604 RepID=A0ABR0K4L7_9EURO|nr:hypothetical protein LTR24_006914 [Lithohypha guttulata]KAK5313989.1 hypothetical protein LTR70_007357 [Exophiala xenobiotica]